MAWVKIPAEHHPLFLAALPQDPRVETVKMFGGVAAKVNGHLFAGLFGLSAMIWLPESERGEALALKGAAPFDPMGDGRKSDKVMLPPAVMRKPAELKKWLARAFQGAQQRPVKKSKPAKSNAAKSKTATAASAKPGSARPKPAQTTTPKARQRSQRA